MKRAITFEHESQPIELAPGIIPDWELPVEVLVVWPERLRAGVGKLKSFYKGFVNQLSKKTKVRVLVHPELNEEVVRSVFEDQDKVRITKVNIADIWLRDYMPLPQRQIYGRSLLKLLYAPAYLKDRNEIYAVEGNNAAILLAETMNYTLDIPKNEFGMPLVLDGGNITLNGKDIAICTNRIITDNESWSLEQIQDVFTRRFGINKLIIVPVEPGDITGHIDGMVRFINPNTVVVGDYSSGYNKQVMDKVALSLANQGLEVHRVKNKICGDSKDSTFPSARGNFINYFRLGNTIYLPKYEGMDEYYENAESVFKGLGIEVEAVQNVDELGDLGGVLNCVTWSSY
jgi:agmatine deiminase